MTYATFHLIFTIPLFFALLFCNRSNALLRSGKAWAGTILLALVALLYTTPWDSYLIREGIWGYSPERVIGTFLLIPFEEYFFIVIQTLSACLLLMKVLEQTNRSYQDGTGGIGRFLLPLGALGVAITVLSFSYAFSVGPFRYLALIAGWGVPVLLFQWVVGYRVLVQFWREWLLGVVPLTAYFWFADWVAIQCEIWLFASTQITELSIATHLPVEEALFFFLTNCMVVQGFILFNKMPLSHLPGVGVRA